MTNKRREFSKDQPFVTHPSAPLGTPLTQIVLPCGGVVGEPIAPSELPTADNPEAEDPLAAAQFAAIARPTLPATPSGAGSTQTCEQVVGNVCEVAIAFLIFGTILGWLTTVPLWLPQVAPKPYSVTPWCVHFYSNSQPFDLVSSAFFSHKKFPRTIETA